MSDRGVESLARMGDREIVERAAKRRAANATGERGKGRFANSKS